MIAIVPSENATHLTLCCLPSQLYPPPSTPPPQSSTADVASENRDVGENVGYPEAELNRCRGIKIGQNECLEQRNKPVYGREGAMTG